MKFHIITSSYPATPDDPSGTAGLFVRQFALELAGLGHTVIVQPAARKQEYHADAGITIVPAPWKGGDQELASMNLMSPRSWWIVLLYVWQGSRNTHEINKKYEIDRTLCMWALPSGLFGLAGKRKSRIPFDIWALGSDIWKIKKIPVVGKMILKKIMKNADRVFADGIQLCRDVKDLAGVPCEFLPSSRAIPLPQEKIRFTDPAAVTHLLFVGRYHVNKGPDLLIQAIALLPPGKKESIRVHLFGLGPMEHELKKMISGLELEKYVYLHGPIQAQQFSNYLDSVSFLVIPSRIESIPVVFSDALQTGTPVIAMPVGDLEDLVKRFSCGIVAESATAEALADAIGKAVTMEKEFFREGTAKAYEKFKLKNAAAQWLNFNSAASHSAADPAPTTSGSR
jgi:hypothetical protein